MLRDEGLEIIFLLFTPVAKKETVDHISRECQDAAINTRAAGARASLCCQLGFSSSWKMSNSEAVAVPSGYQSHCRQEGTRIPRVHKNGGWECMQTSKMNIKKKEARDKKDHKAETVHRDITCL